ncbi:YjcZ family sporulation protein [Fictibacillus sp. b24]|uniref:YjcZ family sporulation protein n=1 Tax=unclassified Fictibacillus TaxID=2644029 RepID=UPI0025A0EFFC|nr:YjcZ family sporulation protein [Fictibacillus sp. b24]MDM5318319.1 YjcZ family sporulation protein [Fictibacillus sp. b24]
MFGKRQQQRNWGYPGYGYGCYTPCGYGYKGYGGGGVFALIVVLFILLIIIGATLR